MPTRSLILAAAAVTGLLQAAPAWVRQTAPTTERLRAVSAVSASVAWAGGNKGTVLRTIDGGRSWSPVPPPDAGALDFRDVEAFSADTAYALSIGPGDKSRIYRTDDGGESWTLQFANPDPNAFYDAMAFWDAQHGLAAGDPVAGRFTIRRTDDGGRTWTLVSPDGMPAALEGDGAFAASGTCLVTARTSQAWLGSGGGPRARVYRTTDRGTTWQASDTPVAAGASSAGIFSIAFADARHGVIVGGDYRKEREPGDNLARSDDGGATWSVIGATRLRAFRSAVVFLPETSGRSLVAAGHAGADRSDDGGATWTALGDEGYHALSVARDGTVWAVGEGGRIARLR